MSSSVKPMSSSPHLEQPEHLAVICQWVSLICVPVVRTVYVASGYSGGLK